MRCKTGIKSSSYFYPVILALLKGNLVLFYFFKFILKYNGDGAGERKEREDNSSFYFIPSYWLSLKGGIFFSNEHMLFCNFFPTDFIERVEGRE